MYIPLRVHSVYSKGKGGATLQELVSWSHQKRLSSLALTDVGNFYGWNRWKRLFSKTNMSPLFGCEVEIEGHKYLFLVKKREGYWNLMEAFNRKDITETEGLVVVFLPQAKDETPPEKLAALVSEDFYFGADMFNLKKAKSWAKKFGRPVVWANPLKFTRNPERLVLLHSITKKIPFPPEWSRWRRTMKCFGPDQETLALKKFGAEAKDVFHRTFEIAEKCEFSFADIVPALPENLFSTTLREVVMEKLRCQKNLNWNERQRARKELKIVEESGFAPYFLVVYDVIQFAQKRGILSNLKGSGASSFLTYLLGISHINPVTFDLYFARFLNKGRKNPPDFDLDFDSRKRDEVLSYVLKKYGQGHGRGQTGAAFVCSLKNYRARSALYETARAFGLPPEESRSMSKKIPAFAEPDFLKKDNPSPGCMQIWKAAGDLTSVYGETSLHVGGVLLTPAPVTRYLPLEKSAKGYVMSHFDRDAVEDLKLIKLDLLSIRGLTAISETTKTLRIKSIPPQDKKAYSLLKTAQTIGCFQVESPAMMNLLRRMKPDNVNDLTQALALIRPGPTESGMKEALLRSREGRPVFHDSSLTRILPETGGLLLYEEQVMQIAERVAGMPPDEGDILRRNLKKRGIRSPLKERFFTGAGERGYTPGTVKKLWKVMEEFSSYSFNKAHSASYAHMAYQAVYLKAHHPLVYLTAVLNAGGGYYGLAEYIEEAKRRGVKVVGPNINRSNYQFDVEGTCIRVGLLLIKGLAVKTAKKIIEERQNGSYLSVEDFLIRVSLTKAELFPLIQSGALDSLEPKRTQQILRYFRGLEGMGEVSDLSSRQKERMVVESLGFDPEGDSLSLYTGKRPSLRVRDLARHVGCEVELIVRVVDARLKGTANGRKYFFLFEDETGLLEGVGETKGQTFGFPPTCYLRGEIKRDGSGRPKVFNCTFPKP